MIHSLTSARRLEAVGRAYCLAVGGAQTISNVTRTVLTLNAASVNNAWGMFDSGSPTRITFKIPGLYLISANVHWANDSTGVRFFGVELNSGSDIVRDRRGAADNSEQTAITVYTMAVGDYIELDVYQDTGSDLDTAAAQLLAVHLGNIL